jgi:hypothetical protein
MRAFDHQAAIDVTKRHTIPVVEVETSSQSGGDANK